MRRIGANAHFTCTTACEPTAGRLACALLTRADLDEGEVGVARSNGLEGEGADASLPVDAG